MGKGSVTAAQRKVAAAGGITAGEPTLVVGPEVVGRKIMLFTKAANDFLPGAITGFNPKNGAGSLISCGYGRFGLSCVRAYHVARRETNMALRSMSVVGCSLLLRLSCMLFGADTWALDGFAETHHIRWDARSAGGKRAEEWLRLGAEHWYLEGPRPPKEKPNPNFAVLPQKAELVGRRIKHFWPKMGRWAAVADRLVRRLCTNIHLRPSSEPLDVAHGCQGPSHRAVH